MRHAITHFTTRAAEKLRKQKLLATVLTVHVSTSPFDDNNEYYSNSATSRLIVPTSDTRELTNLAQASAENDLRGWPQLPACRRDASVNWSTTATSKRICL